jgi:hypothetical protein
VSRLQLPLLAGWLAGLLHAPDMQLLGILRPAPKLLRLLNPTGCVPLCPASHSALSACSFQIERTKYLPAPKVHGAVVEFALLPPEQRLAVPSEAGFLKLVGTGGWEDGAPVMDV